MFTIHTDVHQLSLNKLPYILAWVDNPFIGKSTATTILIIKRYSLLD